MHLIVGLSSFEFWSYSKFWYCWSWYRGDVDRHWRNTLPLLYRTREQVIFGLHNYLNQCRITYLQPHRVVKVFLHCDKSATTPVATTQGDSQIILNYVCKLTVLLPCQYNQHLPRKLIILLQVFDITAREICPGKGGGGGGRGGAGAGGVAPGELGLVIIFV